MPLGYISQYAGSSNGSCVPLSAGGAGVGVCSYPYYCGDWGPAVTATAPVFTRLTGIAFDSMDNLLVADSQNLRIRKVDRKTGIITTVAGNGQACNKNVFSQDFVDATRTCIGGPGMIDVDPSGNLYFTEPYDGKIRKVSNAGIISTLVNSGSIVVAYQMIPRSNIPYPIKWHNGQVSTQLM